MRTGQGMYGPRLMGFSSQSMSDDQPISRPSHPPPGQACSQRQYWRFYWPLALTGVMLLLGRQLQNGVLARYPEAVRELATYALASSTFFLFNAPLAFVPQLANALARTRQAHRLCLRVVVGTCLCLTIPMIAAAFFPSGAGLFARLYGVRPEVAADVVRYLRWLCPLVLVNGIRRYCTGLLIQCRRTGVVTLLNALYLTVLAVVLCLGLPLGWSAVSTLVLAQGLASVAHLACVCVCALRLRPFPDREEREPNDTLTPRAVFEFYWPVALTSFMFALSRPILYSIVGRIPDPEPQIAALRVAFDLAMIFHGPLNQFRHLFLTFGESDRRGLRLFMIRVMLAVMAMMLVLASTPVATLCMQGVLGIRGEVFALARDAFRVMCLIPLVITLRNYFHGLSLLQRRTRSMGAGAVLRNVTICALALGLQCCGRLNHATSALVLVLGFGAECVVAVAARRYPTKSPSRACR